MSLLSRTLALQAKDALPEMPVRLLDPKAGAWTAVECSAEEGEELPKPRGGHSVRRCRQQCYLQVLPRARA